MSEPFLTITEPKGQQSVLLLNYDRVTTSFPATEEGAKSLGAFLRKKGFRSWLHSSSFDHPTEYGAPDLDFHALVQEGYGTVSDPELLLKQLVGCLTINQHGKITGKVTPELWNEIQEVVRRES